MKLNIKSEDLLCYSEHIEVVIVSKQYIEFVWNCTHKMVVYFLLRKCA